jgi:hypothetical protein
MFYNDWTIQQLAAEHQRELRRQAEAERLAQAAVPQPDRSRWFHWLGQQLIITGQRLQAHHKAAVTMAATSAAVQAATERGCQTR